MIAERAWKNPILPQLKIRKLRLLHETADPCGSLQIRETLLSHLCNVYLNHPRMIHLTSSKIATLLLGLLPLTVTAQWGATYRLQAENSAAKSAAQKSGAAEPVEKAAKISILTDLSQSTTGGGESQKKIGNGRLGVAFVTERFYGDLSFAVFTSDRSQATNRLTDTAFFYNTLLLAQHQTGGLNEFSGSIGMNGLLRGLLPAREGENPYGLRASLRENFGLHCNFRSSNQYWEKDSVYADVLLNAFSLLLSYRAFDFQLEEESWGHLQLFLFGGFTTRRLGGNYALDRNYELRQDFLGIDKYVFDGWEYGARIELGPFYGKASFTEFDIADNIPGFSGPQLAVRIGATIKLDLLATY
jgi:hypothetical protein